MGLQGSNLGDVNLASVVVIDQACESDQLLVSLCRNELEWLSPVGWTAQQKITLLDCRSIGGKTEIEIPAEFALSLVQGDTLVLKCSELDLTQNITWESSNFGNRSIEDSKPVASSLTSGLLARFKGVKAEPVSEDKSEAQKRAEDAERAAQNYKAKMEAATAAKEEAQRKALDAAREAEAALKMEAERISEMERAAKAFEEAERLKQDELRRVEEERRAEEARIAEEARRIEEARKREAEAKLAAERKAALERLETALDATQNEEAHLRTRLNRLETDAEDLNNRQSDQIALETELTETYNVTEARVGKSRESYEKITAKLGQYTSELSSLQVKADNLDVDQASLTTQLEQVETDYLEAQKEAKMAAALAEEKRKLRESFKAERTAISEQITRLSDDLHTQARLVSETTVKSQKSQSKLESAQADLSNKTLEIETIQREKQSLSKTLQTSRMEREATKQAIEDAKNRQAAHLKAIAHLEAGGDPKKVDEVELVSQFFTPRENSSDYQTSLTDIQDEAENRSVFGRVRRSFLREKDAQISIEVDDPVLADPLIDEPAVEEEVFDSIDDTPTIDVETTRLDEAIDAEDVPIESHKTRLWTLGAILGGAAILGGGFLINQAQQPKVLTVKSSPSQVKATASIATPIAMPDAAAETIIEPAIEPAIADLIEPKVNKIEISNISKAEIKEVAEVSVVAAELSQIEMPEIPIPNLIQTGFALQNAAIPAKDVVIKETPVKKEVAVKAPAKKLTKPKNYPELTKRVQQQLKTLGFYYGPLNGLQTTETTQAITMFQSENNLPKVGSISGKFLTELKNAEYRYYSSQRQASIPQKDPESFDIATIQTNISQNPIYGTVQAVPSIPVTAGVLSAPETRAVTYEETYSAPQTPTTLETATFATSVIVKEATAPIIKAPISTPIAQSVPKIEDAPAVPPVQDVVVEAQKTKQAKATYPRAAIKSDYFVDVRIVVGYDIDTAGKVTNMRIVSNDHNGRFNSAFEKAAVRAIKRQRFSPKTINGQAVVSTGQVQRIVFRAG